MLKLMLKNMVKNLATANIIRVNDAFYFIVFFGLFVAAFP